MKNKTLFLSIVLALGFLVGAKDALIFLFGEHWGIITVAFVTLGYQITSLILKSPVYDTGNWMKGWKGKFIYLNVALLIPTIIGTIQVWSVDYSVHLHSGLVIFMSKFTVICNLVIVAINSDWETLRKQLLPGSNV